MIKVGLSHNLPDVVGIMRLLQRHPDVEIEWMYNYGRTVPVTSLYPDLCGETAMSYCDNPAFDKIDLYIGPLKDDILVSNPSLKAIFTREGIVPAAVDDIVIEAGVPEFNRKALVRGARATVVPDSITYLGALALMPLAKNLLLGSAIDGSVLLSDQDNTGSKSNIDAWGPYMSEFVTEHLRTVVLAGLQNSFNQPLRITTFSHTGPVSMATFVVDTRMSIEDIRSLYHDFYDDHNHVVILPENVSTLRASMVQGTNKTAIHLAVDNGRLFVSVAFDDVCKMGSAIFIHLLNLLFGLDERTGL